MDKLSELAARCEAATGPDKKLEVLIYWHSGIGPAEYPVYADKRDIEAIGCIFGRDPAKRPEELTVDDVGYSSAIMRHYTSSLDGAMALMPEGWHLGCLTECGEDDGPFCCVTENAEPCRDVVCTAATPALALCAAALRARATLSGSSSVKS